MTEYDKSLDPIETRLDPGESVNWRGQPVKKSYVLAGNKFYFILIGFWCLFAIIFEIDAIGKVISGRGSIAFALAGLIPFAIFSPFILAPIVISSKSATKTYYAVTNNRIMIATGLLHKRFTSLDLCETQAINLRIRRNGVGDIYFGHSGSTGGWGFWSVIFWLGDQLPSFYCIENVEKVFHKIRELKAQAAERRISGQGQPPTL